jgi:hypothetical protein
MTRCRLANLLIYSVLLFTCFVARAVAEEETRFTIEDIETELHEDGVYYLDARLDVSLGGEMLTALRNGVSLVLQLDLELIRPRRFWINELLATIEQRYQLHFHALTQQYSVNNLNTGIQESFHTLQGALDYLSRIRSLPILDVGLLRKGESYQARLRLHLDLSSLPLPIQVKAYAKRGWRTTSPWMVWTMP